MPDSQLAKAAESGWKGQSLSSEKLPDNEDRSRQPGGSLSHLSDLSEKKKKTSRQEKEASLRTSQPGHVPVSGSGKLAVMENVPEVKEIHYLTTPAEVERIVQDLLREPSLGLDLETTGLDPHTNQIRLVSLATRSGVVYLVDAFHVPLRMLSALLGAEGPLLIGHNLKFDLGFLLAAGLWQGKGNRLLDTGLAHQLYRASPKFPALMELVPYLDKSLQISSWERELSKEQLRYAALDALTPLYLGSLLLERLSERGVLQALKVEMLALPAVAWMEVAGVPFDLNLWEEELVKAEARFLEVLDRLPSGINWNSSPQVLKFLQQQGLNLTDTREETLVKFLGNPFVEDILLLRKWAKRINTYGRDWQEYIHPKTKRIHPSWQQIGAETGRMACRNPNLQNIPREPGLRRAFRAEKSRVIVKADFSQIELRIAAVISGEERMISAFHRGEDLHSLTAAQVLGKSLDQVTREDRQLAKGLNFGLLYGMGPERLREYLKKEYGIQLSLDEAIALRKRFFRSFPNLRVWHWSQGKGETEVWTLGGRKRVTDRFTEKLNTPVQGTGADGLKVALALLWERKEKVRNTFPILAVHDELVVDAPEEEAEEALAWLTTAMKEGMGNILQGVPVEVEGGIFHDWGVSPVPPKGV